MLEHLIPSVLFPFPNGIWKWKWKNGLKIIQYHGFYFQIPHSDFHYLEKNMEKFLDRPDMETVSKSFPNFLHKWRYLIYTTFSGKDVNLGARPPLLSTPRMRPVISLTTINHIRPPSIVDCCCSLFLQIYLYLHPPCLIKAHKRVAEGTDAVPNTPSRNASWSAWHLHERKNIITREHKWK